MVSPINKALDLADWPILSNQYHIGVNRKAKTLKLCVAKDRGNEDAGLSKK